MPSPLARRPRGLLLTVVLAAATVLGGWQAYGLLYPGPPPGSLPLPGVTYTVQHSEQVAGLSDQDLSGMNHGIQGLVTDDKALVRVSLAVLAGGGDTTFDPAVLYLDDGRGGAPMTPVGGTLAPGRLNGGAALDGALTFVVPRAGEHLTLRAPGTAATVDLLTVDQAPAGAGGHTHAGSGPAGPVDPAVDPGGADAAAGAGDPFALDPVAPAPAADAGNPDQTPSR
jgi:hypothetical protein